MNAAEYRQKYQLHICGVLMPIISSAINVNIQLLPIANNVYVDTIVLSESVIWWGSSRVEQGECT
jgi:hypothetical protein